MKINKIIILFFVCIVICNICYGTEEVYDEVSKGFRISEFTKEAKKYTDENFPEFDLDEFIKNSMSGKSNFNFIKKSIIKVFGSEITSRSKTYEQCFSIDNNREYL